MDANKAEGLLKSTTRGRKVLKKTLAILQREGWEINDYDVSLWDSLYLTAVPAGADDYDYREVLIRIADHAGKPGRGGHHADFRFGVSVDLVEKTLTGLLRSAA